MEKRSLCKNLFIIFSLSRRVKPNGVIMVTFFFFRLTASNTQKLHALFEQKLDDCLKMK